MKLEVYNEQLHIKLEKTVQYIVLGINSTPVARGTRDRNINNTTNPFTLTRPRKEQNFNLPFIFYHPEVISTNYK